MTDFNKVEDLNRRAARVTAQARGMNSAHQRQREAQRRENYSPSYLQEDEQRRGAALLKQKAQLVGNLPAELQAALSETANWSRRGYVKSFIRHTPAPANNAGLLSGDAVQRAMLAELLELQTAAHWRETARDMTDDELVETFSSELAAHRFANARILMAEGDRRASNAPSGVDGMETRSLPRRVDQVLNESALFEGPETAIRDLRLAEFLVGEALSASSPADDKGIRAQTIHEMRQRGASNEEINSALYGAA